MTVKTLDPKTLFWVSPEAMTVTAVDNTAGTERANVYTRASNVRFATRDQAAGTVSSYGYQEDIFKPVLSEHARGIQEELRALRNDIPDPVQAMVEFLNNLPGDDDRWREIVEEPYG